MNSLKRILTGTLLAISSLSCSQSIAQGSGQYNLTRFDHRLTVGFERNVSTLYLPGKVQLSDKTRKAEANYNKVLLRMRLTNMFRIETGLSYKNIDRLLAGVQKASANIDLSKPSSISVPLTIQYHFANDRCRLHPYFGAGVQYTRTGNCAAASGDYLLYNTTSSTSSQYLNVILTQGLIFDVTPDLQITQSIHVVPHSGIKPIGLNVGVGYRLK